MLKLKGTSSPMATCTGGRGLPSFMMSMRASVPGAAASSSTRSLKATSLSTIPKLGEATMTRRRSASLGRPVSSRCTGAWKPSVSRSAGTSWICPSLMKIEPGNRLDALLDLGQGRGRLRAARRHVLARGIVDHDHRDVVQIFAVLADGGGIGERGQEGDAGEEAPEAAARPAQEGHRQEQECQDPAGQQQGPGQERRELDAEGAEGHWPSRSRIAGTCTWSDL